MTEMILIPRRDVTLPEVQVNRHWIGGAWLDGADWSERVSPSHGVVVSRSAKGGEAEAEAAIAAARAAFDDGRWSRLSAKARAAVLLRGADLIEAHVERFALIETLESGKPISQVLRRNLQLSAIISHVCLQLN